jgi:hypothetical protein
MKHRTRRSAARAPLMFAQMSLASWEVIGRRGLMMLRNTCSPAEYRRMVAEKHAAALATSARLATSGGFASLTALMAPWHSRVTANAKRLRKR